MSESSSLEKDPDFSVRPGDGVKKIASPGREGGLGNYMSYEKFGTANGPGIRSSVFLSGCSFRCPGCWNPSSWSSRNGAPVTDEWIEEAVENLSHESISGLSILGGEPFENLQAATLLAKKTREAYGDGKNIWIWSGYTFEQIMKDPKKFELLKLCDVLVDGRFVLGLRDITLKFRGSLNQRIIDVQNSINSRKPCLIENFMGA